MVSGIGTGLVFLAALGFTGLARADSAFERDNRAWRAGRVARLTAPDGWLTLIGLHFLQPGANTVGHAPENDIVLAEGPDRVGTVALEPDGRVTLVVASGVDAMIDGKRQHRATLEWRENVKPTIVTIGTMNFHAIDRGGKKALRVKDSTAERRVNFAGLDYFHLDPAWRIEARWEPFERARQVSITNVLGQTSLQPATGRAVFEYHGQTFALLPIDDGPGEPLFFVIADATSGKETYDAARFVYADRPRDGTVVLDFNRAQNPPCAFTPFATCPLPPPQNRLPFAVTAGEKKYRGEH